MLPFGIKVYARRWGTYLYGVANPTKEWDNYYVYELKGKNFSEYEERSIYIHEDILREAVLDEFDTLWVS